MARTIFNSVKGLHPRRNSFSAHTYRNDFTAKLGVNLPVYQQHTTAGTRVYCSASALVRLQALISPIMDNLDFYLHFWQVPYRLIEDDRFTTFISGEMEDDAEYDALFLTPSVLMSGFASYLISQGMSPADAEQRLLVYLGNGSLFDFLGYDKTLFSYQTYRYDDETGTSSFIGSNIWKSLNFRPVIMYYMLHDHWYMNENVPYFDDFIDNVKKLVKDQDVNCLFYLVHQTYEKWGTTFLPHAWEKDYFTSALPNVQYGTPVSLPMSDSAPVSIPLQGAMIQGGTQTGLQFDFRLSPVFGKNVQVGNHTNSVAQLVEQDNPDNRIVNLYGNLQGLDNFGEGQPLSGTADLSEASAITINELRFANALQVFKEREMRFGRRRLEYYIGFFDVTPEDLRLQVPKYLGGGRIPINIADIEQTSQTSGNQPLGRLAGKATAVAGGFAGFKTWCSEETLLLGIAFAMPHITYANSLSRFLTKTNDRYDYFNPSFEHLGEQAIESIEVFAGAAPGEFGYTPRYTEYRYHGNEVHGEFKDTLSYWTLARIFDNTPALNADFIYMQPSVFDRIFAVDDEQPMLVSMIFRQRIVQPVSKFGTPMLLA